MSAIFDSELMPPFRTADAWAGYHFTNTGMSTMPPKCLQLVEKYGEKFGGCGEVCITAFAHYAVFELGLKAEADMFVPEDSHREIWDNLTPQ